jgi:anthranilate phosphoribosyltransferase
MADTPSPATWPSLLARLVRGDSLSSADTAWAMDEIMAGEATPAQLAAFAVLLRAKGETAEEIAGLAQTMLARCLSVRVERRSVDIVGTGGDHAQTVNISTMAAIVVAGSGRPVLKHGNRAATSACGAADVLEELGVVIDLPAAGVEYTVADVGIGFCFAPVFHAGYRHASGPRREIGVPTAFNLLGPLTNPGRPAASAIGCADARAAGLIADVLAGRGVSALVFRGDDGLDELTTTTTSRVWAVSDGTVTETVLDPARHEIAVVPATDLRGGDRIYNAQVVRDVLAGGGGGARDAVLLNAAAGIAAYDGLAGVGVAGGVDAVMAAALTQAREAIDSGAAEQLLARWVASSQRAKGV